MTASNAKQIEGVIQFLDLLDRKDHAKAVAVLRDSAAAMDKEAKVKDATIEAMKTLILKHREVILMKDRILGRKMGEMQLVILALRGKLARKNRRLATEVANHWGDYSTTRRESRHIERLCQFGASNPPII